MFLPIGDEPRLRGTPMLTYVLIGINVAVYFLIASPLAAAAVDPSDPALVDYLRFVALPRVAAGVGVSPDVILTDPSYRALLRDLIDHISTYDLFLFEHGFKPGAPSLIDLVAAMFLHANIAHLAGNMLFLWIYGRNVEAQAGRISYAALYLTTGVAATALHAVFQSGSMIPMVGASGAISGVLGIYFWWFPRNRVRVLIFLGFFIQVFSLPARWVLGFYLVVDNLLPFLGTTGAAGVAYGAHIGGFFGGLGAAALVRRWQTRQSVIGRAGSASPRAESVRDLFGDGDPASPSDAFRKAIATERWDLALRLYTDLPVRERLRLGDADILALSDWLGERDQDQAALAVLQRYIATHPTSRSLPAAHLRAAALQLRAELIPSAYQHYLAVLDLDPTREEAADARLGLEEVERLNRAARRFRFH
ncbi:MAG: rhomboid family intramembrane serine protease [Myxococcota bacterium]